MTSAQKQSLLKRTNLRINDRTHHTLHGHEMRNDLLSLLQVIEDQAKEIERLKYEVIDPSLPFMTAPPTTEFARYASN